MMSVRKEQARSYFHSGEQDICQEVAAGIGKLYAVDRGQADREMHQCSEFKHAHSQGAEAAHSVGRQDSSSPVDSAGVRMGWQAAGEESRDRVDSPRDIPPGLHVAMSRPAKYGSATLGNMVHRSSLSSALGSVASKASAGSAYSHMEAALRHVVRIRQILGNQSPGSSHMSVFNAGESRQKVRILDTSEGTGAHGAQASAGELPLELQGVSACSQVDQIGLQAAIGVVTPVNHGIQLAHIAAEGSAARNDRSLLSVSDRRAVELKYTSGVAAQRRSLHAHRETDFVTAQTETITTRRMSGQNERVCLPPVNGADGGVSCISGYSKEEGQRRWCGPTSATARHSSEHGRPPREDIGAVLGSQLNRHSVFCSVPLPGECEECTSALSGVHEDVGGVHAHEYAQVRVWETGAPGGHGSGIPSDIHQGDARGCPRAQVKVDGHSGSDALGIASSSCPGDRPHDPWARHNSSGCVGRGGAVNTSRAMPLAYEQKHNAKYKQSGEIYDRVQRLTAQRKVQIAPAYHDGEQIRWSQQARKLWARAQERGHEVVTVGTNVRAAPAYMGTCDRSRAARCRSSRRATNGHDIHDKALVRSSWARDRESSPQGDLLGQQMCATIYGKCTCVRSVTVQSKLLKVKRFTPKSGKTNIDEWKREVEQGCAAHRGTLQKRREMVLASCPGVVGVFSPGKVPCYEALGIQTRTSALSSHVGVGIQCITAQVGTVAATTASVQRYKRLPKWVQPKATPPITRGFTTATGELVTYMGRIVQSLHQAGNIFCDNVAELDIVGKGLIMGVHFQSQLSEAPDVRGKLLCPQDHDVHLSESPEMLTDRPFELSDESLVMLVDKPTAFGKSAEKGPGPQRPLRRVSDQEASSKVPDKRRQARTQVTTLVSSRNETGTRCYELTCDERQWKAG